MSTTSKQWNVPWTNQNTVRSYPLTNDATKRDVSTTFKLPDDLIAGIYLSVPMSMVVNPSAFFLKTVRSVPSSVAFEIGYAASGGDVVVATAAVLKSQHTFGKAYPLRGVGDFYDAGGAIVVGEFANLDKQPAGSWQFSLAGGRLEPDVVRPQLRGVTSLRASNDISDGEPVVGDIVFRAGRNFRITTIAEVGQDTVFMFDAIEGEGLNEECVCEDGSPVGDPILSINNVRPGPDGNINLEGSECVEFSAIAGGLKVRNTCSEPCCGCKELKVVTDQLEQFGRQATTLEGMVNALEAQVTQMDQVVLGSRLGDRGCNTCE